MNGVAVLAGWALRALARDRTEEERLKQCRGPVLHVFAGSAEE